MIWNLIYCIANVVLLLMCGRVFCTAPDWIQKCVLLSIMVSGALLLAYYTLLLTGARFDDPGSIVATILMFEHIGICTFVIRLWLQGYGLCKRSSTRYRQSALS